MSQRDVGIEIFAVREAVIYGKRTKHFQARVYQDGLLVYTGKFTAPLSWEDERLPEMVLKSSKVQKALR